MATVIKWEGVEVLVLILVFLVIALLHHSQPHRQHLATSWCLTLLLWPPVSGYKSRSRLWSFTAGGPAGGAGAARGRGAAGAAEVAGVAGGAGTREH